MLPAERASYVMGNPPFVGAKFMDDAQRADTRTVFDGIANAGLLDFVAAWYVKAARYIQGLPQYCSFSLSLRRPVALIAASDRAEPGRGRLFRFGVLGGRDWHRMNSVA